MLALLDFLREMRKGVSKQSYLFFVLIGIFLVYYNQGGDAAQAQVEKDKIVVGIGYCFIVVGFVLGVAASLISIKLEIYEHIIARYKEVADINFTTLKEDRQFHTFENREKDKSVPLSKDIGGKNAHNDRTQI